MLAGTVESNHCATIALSILLFMGVRQSLSRNSGICNGRIRQKRRTETKARYCNGYKHLTVVVQQQGQQQQMRCGFAAFLEWRICLEHLCIVLPRRDLSFRLYKDPY